MGILKNIVKYLASSETNMPTKLPARNETCWCGSGKKYKKCHFHEDEKKLRKKYAASCYTSA